MPQFGGDPHTPAQQDPEDAEIFDLLKATDRDLVQRYQPKFLARGGEHVVYEIPDHPNIVVKGDAQSFYKVQEWNASHGLPLDGMDPEFIPEIQEHLQNHRARMQRLTEYFGAAHVPRMREHLMRVPMTDAIIRSIHLGEPPAAAKGMREAWGIVRVQRRAPELADPTCASVVSGYAEQQPQEPDQYARVTRSFVDGDASAVCSVEDAHVLVSAPMRELLVRAANDGVLRETLRDFVERTIRYTAETGEMLDLAGFGNVTVFQTDAGWSYRLVDALYPSARKTMDRVREAITKAAQGVPLDENETIIILNAVNFARTMNILAREVGVVDRIDIVPPDAKGKVDFLALLGGTFAVDEPPPDVR